MKRFCILVMSFLIFAVNVYAEETRPFFGIYPGLMYSEMKTSMENAPSLIESNLFTEDSSTGAFMLVFGNSTSSVRGHLNILGGKYDDFDLGVVTIAADKIFSVHDNFNLYMGLSVGYGWLTWNEEMEPLRLKDETATSLVGGGQLGGILKFCDHFSFDIGYNYLFTKFKTEIICLDAVGEGSLENIGLFYVGANYHF